LDQVVGKDLQTESELGKFFNRVGTMPDGGAEHGTDLDVLFVSHRGDEMSDPGLADPDGFLAALEEIGIVVERAGLAFLQQAAVAWVVLNRRERMRVEVEHLEPQPGRRRKAVHHPGELRTTDQRAKLPFLRFYLHQCCPAFEGMARPSRQQRCNSGKPVAQPALAPEFGLYSRRTPGRRLILGPILALHRYTGH